MAELRAAQMRRQMKTKYHGTDEGGTAMHSKAIHGWTDEMDPSPSRAPCGAKNTRDKSKTVQKLKLQNKQNTNRNSDLFGSHECCLRAFKVCEIVSSSSSRRKLLTLVLAAMLFI